MKITLTELQKQALVYFAEGEKGEMPKNYLNNRWNLQSKKLLKRVEDPECRKYSMGNLVLTDLGNSIYFQI